MRNKLSGRKTMPRRNSRPGKNTLFLGVGFSLSTLTSDKNFWSGFVRNLSRKNEQVVVVSINHSAVAEEHRGNVHIYNVRPFFSFNKNENGIGYVNGSANGISNADGSFTGNGLHNPYLYNPGILRKHPELLLTQFRLVPLLRQLIQTHNIGTIHLLDNFGWLNRLIKTFLPKIKLGLTLVTFNRGGRNENFYSLYQKLALRKLDYLVVTSHASRKKVSLQGIRNDGVSSINWGIDFKSNRSGGGRRSASKLYGKFRHCLWTGFIQQVDLESFQFTRRIAERLAEINPDLKFTFAFKPECLPEQSIAFSSPRIRIVSTNPEEFAKLLKQTDLLVSPILNYRSVCAPPLSWIESLALGIPIVSTPAPGVSEILLANQTGLVGRTPAELAAKITHLLDDPRHYRTLSTNARKLAKTEYSLDKIVNQYLQLWEDKNGLPG